MTMTTLAELKCHLQHRVEALKKEKPSPDLYVVVFINAHSKEYYAMCHGASNGITDDDDLANILPTPGIEIICRLTREEADAEARRVQSITDGHGTRFVSQVMPLESYRSLDLGTTMASLKTIIEVCDKAYK